MDADDVLSPVHFGLVVWSSALHERSAVIIDIDELSETGFCKTRFVSPKAFQLPRQCQNWESDEKKNLTRRLSVPLYFGDWIEWQTSHQDGHGNIEWFTRSRALRPSRIKDSLEQILLEGVINPDDPTQFYTDFFRNIKIPFELVGQASPNVFLEGWVTLCYNNDKSVEFVLHSYHGVCSPDKQIDIGSVPWNRSDPRLRTFIPPPSDDEDDEYGGFAHLIENPKKRDGVPDLELYKREAYLTGERTFWLREFPDYKCIIPIKPKESIVKGRLYSIDVVWHTYGNAYIVTNVAKAKSAETLSVDPGTGLLRCMVKAHEKYRGFYRNETFGIIDDPYGHLTLLHLTTGIQSAIPVALIDDGPNRSAQLRFRIKDVLGDKKDQLFKFQQREKPIRFQTIGCVLAETGSVYSAEHGAVAIKFASGEAIPLAGTRIKFNATYNDGAKCFYIDSNSMEIITTGTPIVTDTRRMSRRSGARQTIFKTVVRTCPMENLNKLFFSEDFGVIDDNLGIVKFDKKSRPGDKYIVWVKPAEAELHEPQPRTFFHIVGAGDEPPHDRSTFVELTLIQQTTRQEFLQTITETVAKNQMDAIIPESDDAHSLVPLETTGRRSVDASPSHMTNTANNPRYFGGFHRSHHADNDRLSLRSQSSIYSGSGRFSVDQSFARMNVNASPAGSSFTMGRDDTTPYQSGDERESHCSGDSGSTTFRRPTRRTNIPPYDGPVFAAPGSTYTYDIPETLARIKKHKEHLDSCGSSCSIDCPYVMTLATLVVSHKDFWQEANRHYPQFAKIIMRDIVGVQK